MQRQEIIAGFFEKEQLRSRPGGFFSWLTLPPQWRAHEFVAAALRNGVSVTGGEQFQVDRSLPMDAVRIALDGAPGQDLLRRGLMILSDLLQHHPEPWSAVV
jgi:DNA-binding transcriptional MocR family regulator